VINMNIERVKEVVRTFPERKILIVGDVMLDHYILGEIERLNPERRATNLVKVTGHSDVLGGAGNTASNIASLGATAYLYGVMGNDKSGKVVYDLVSYNGIKSRIISLRDRITTTTNRLIADDEDLIARFDEEMDTRLNRDQTNILINHFRESDLDADVYLISDYGKGIITKTLVKFLRMEAKRRKKLFIVEPKPINASIYYDMDFLMLNSKEAREITGLDKNKHINHVGRKLISKYWTGGVVITCGKEGMKFFGQEGLYHHSKGKSVPVYDLSGAGDTALAIFSLGLASELGVKDSMSVANHAAAVVIGKVGTATLTLDELLASLDKK